MLHMSFTSVALTVCLLAGTVLSAAATAQVTSPPLPKAPAQPDWSNQRTSSFKPERPMPHAMEQLRRDGRLMGPVIEHPEARRLLLGTSWLPVMDPVLLNISASGNLAATTSQFEELPVDLRASTDWHAQRFDSYAVYYPLLRTPIWTVRPAEILISQLSATLPQPDAQDPTQQPEPSSIAPNANKPLRGQRILLVTSESFVLARLLAGQGASVTLVIPVPNAVEAALQTDAAYQGTVAGHGMGENIAPDGSLTVLATYNSAAFNKLWLTDPVIKRALAQKVAIEGPFTASLIIDSDSLSTPPSRDALAALSDTPDAPFLAPTAVCIWYTAAYASDAAQRARDLLQNTKPPLTDDSPAFQKIAQALGWHEANNPVPTADCLAAYCNLP